MNTTEYSILLILYALSCRINRPYAAISPDTFLSQLDKIHHIKIGRRWLFQCLQELGSEGYVLRRLRRHSDQLGHITSRPSLFWVSAKTLKLLITKLVTGSRAALDSLFKYIKEKDNRGPSPEELLAFRTARDKNKPFTEIKEILKPFT